MSSRMAVVVDWSAVLYPAVPFKNSRLPILRTEDDILTGAQALAAAAALTGAPLV